MNQHTLISQWVNQWQNAMLRFARLHLSSVEDAEDAVQETFAALLQNDLSTINSADPRPYLFGILRNKVMDKLRQRYRNPVADDVNEEDLDALLFDAQDHWAPGMAPASWQTPDAHAEGGQFFAVLDICVNNLPPKPARVFSMKEFLECDAAEICATLNISQSDYWQNLSRARKQIHLCLNQRWFAGATLP
ncbi:MAG: sigma-70 family RNA polymerase sigma factor [Oceanospirillaceae bacterium]|nr:sigma-70 family RNA polymerase sigma factor [Oceanospirillaceae bacterium]MCP5334639.1 sigma-70 family RNA polymerase sigma factor [Oceanospirillaceae bacterium]MCP5351353.1 sigma-70 family RNA polymerase sigma factor [Oceanospirillaceae bacterium]